MRAAAINGDDPSGEAMVRGLDLNVYTFGLGANNLDAAQHTDAEAGQFFQRIRFDLAGVRASRADLEGAIAAVAALHEMRWSMRYAAALMPRAALRPGLSMR